MAEPIPLELPPRDPRDELRVKLEKAPLDHAEALLATYEILQGLHDKGMLETVRGAIGSSDQLLELIVNASKKPESIRAMRNVIVLAKLLSAIDPEMLAGLSRAVPEGLASAQSQEPLTLLQLLRKFSAPDSRRALTAMACALESAGKTLNGAKPDV